MSKNSSFIFPREEKRQKPGIDKQKRTTREHPFPVIIPFVPSWVLSSIIAAFVPRTLPSYVPSTVATSSTTQDTRLVSTTRAHTSVPAVIETIKWGFVRGDFRFRCVFSRREERGSDGSGNSAYTYLSTPLCTRYRTRLPLAAGPTR